MTLLLIALTLTYLWSYVQTLINLPNWFIFVYLPVAAFGLSFLPMKVLTALAACGIVYVIENVVHRQAPKAKDTRRRRSNIPPPP